MRPSHSSERPTKVIRASATVCRLGQTPTSLTADGHVHPGCASLRRARVSRDGSSTDLCAYSCSKRLVEKDEHEIEGYFQEIITSFFAIPANLMATASKNRSLSVLLNALCVRITHEASVLRHALLHFGRFSSTISVIALSESTAAFTGDPVISYILSSYRYLTK